MKKVFMSMAFVAAMFAAASCACNSNSQAEEAAPVEAGCCGGDCADCSEGCESTEQCEVCDSTAADCQKAQ